VSAAKSTRIAWTSITDISSSFFLALQLRKKITVKPRRPSSWWPARGDGVRPLLRGLLLLLCRRGQQMPHLRLLLLDR
jgi:hypothetical protein